MKGTITYNNTTWAINYNQPLDISLPLTPSHSVKAFDAPPLRISPVQQGEFIGSVAAGAPINFFNITLNPHGNGTHTECVGHITEETIAINHCLQRFCWFAEVVTIRPVTRGNDEVITKAQLQKQIENPHSEAIIIRTLPNTSKKKTKNYSGTNPPYLTAKSTAYLQKQGIQHLLVDLPSVDREEDGGELAAHKAFWNYPASTRHYSTITELIYVPNDVPDGQYLLHLQIISLQSDASPSKPILYQLTPC